MLFARMKKLKNKKAMTLVEMIVAIAVTAILAVCLSMVLSPVVNTYGVNKTRAELSSFADRAMENIALDLRGASEVRVTQNRYSSPGESGYYGYFACDEFKIGGNAQKGDFYLTRCDWHYIFQKIFLIPDVRKNYANMTEAEVKKELDLVQELAPSGYGHAAVNLWHYKKFAASCNNIQLNGDGGFFVLVRKNPDDGDRGNVLEIHLKVKKAKITYEAIKSVVCENLFINHESIKTANLYENNNATISTVADPNNSKNTKYYSVWFKKE